MRVYWEVARRAYRRQSTYRATTTAAELVARVAAMVPLRDLSIEEPDIEEIVRRIYQAPRPEQ